MGTRRQGFYRQRGRITDPEPWGNPGGFGAN